MSVIHYSKPDILASLDPQRHAVIEASAGTGKTFLIEHMVIELLLTGGVSLDQILVVTFTEKATAELKTRLRASLMRLLAADATQPASDGAHWVLDASARSTLEQALYAFGSAPIFTIHGFCQRILTEYAFDHRRLFSQSQVDGDTAFDRAFTTVVRNELARNEVDQRWLRQWLERSSLDELRRLLAWCLRTKAPMRPAFDPDVFTESLQRLQSITHHETRLQAVLDEVEAARMHGGTKRAILKRVEDLALFLSDDGESASVPTLLGELNHKELTYLDDRLCRQMDAMEPGGELQLFCQALQAFQQACLPFPAAIAQRFLPAIERQLRQEKQRQGWYDFDDMLALVWEGLQGPEGAGLVEALRARYRYALIDEFQDTDPIQWQIFRRIFLESDQANILYGIGDPKQAIYAFRGADIYTYLDARDEIQAAGGLRVSLKDNYRSTAAMVAAFNEIFTEATKLPFFSGAIRYDTPVECGNPEWRCDTGDGTESPPLHLLYLAPGALTLTAAMARAAFGRYIAQTIKHVLADGQLRVGHPDIFSPVTASDILILTRTGNEGVEMAHYLQAEGIPYSFYKQDGLFQTPEAQAICDLLMAIAEPQEQAKRYKAWMTPFFGLALEALSSCRDLPSSHPLVQPLLSWKGMADRYDFAALFADILNTSGFARRELFWREDGRELTNVQHVFEVLLEESRQHAGTLADLILTLKAFISGRQRPVGENGTVQRLASDREAVQIMTMHKSKGLEAAVVFLYGGFAKGPSGQIVVRHQERSRVTHVEPDDDARNAARREEEEEEQRLLYVALTRAKARLYLPVIEPERYPERFQGCHRRLNTRLTQLLADPNQILCQVHPFTLDSIQLPMLETSESLELTGWRPASALFETPDLAETFRRARQRHAAFVVSSYSRLKHADGGYRPMSAPVELSRDGLEPVVIERSDTDLPGGTLSGRFVHDVLEHLPLESFEEATSFDAWCVRPDIVDLFARFMRRYARSPQYLEASQRLVYAGFTTPIDVEGDVAIPGLAACTPFLRETEFLYPIPEDAHPRLSEVPTGPFRIEKGYIKGFVDFVCRYEGRSYLGDWKTDTLPSYDPEVLDAHIQQNYTWQLKLYALALVKMLNIHSEADYQNRFGGMLYCFLRGMAQADETASGLLFSRPSWTDILDYEVELLTRDVFV